MSAFPMCPDCRREYEDPSNRRFHAEPNACPVCGPRLSLRGPGGEAVPAGDPLGTAAEELLRGRIVAVRGRGGFQLAADATNEEAGRALRERKRREEKPFAAMFPDIASVRAAARISRADEAILRDPSAPILLCPSRASSPLAPAVSMGMPTVGVFLPYSPLHRLLLSRVGRPLVMTSGNQTDEPIAIGNDEALTRLRGIADLYLLHDREVVQRSDDSVVRRVGRAPYPIRRARGFVPAPVRLSRSFPDVAGLGADLKGTFCFIREDAAYLSQHLGDLELSLSRDFYRESFRFFREFLGAEPVAACHDLHPAYFTTSFAEELARSARLFPLQHHKAHMYSVMAETGFLGKAVGVAFDGTGYGEDGTIWGGEFFAVNGEEVTRAGHLSRFSLPGGDAAVREPWRTALSLLRDVLGRPEAERRRASCSRGPRRLGAAPARRAGQGDQRGAHVQRRAALRRRLRDRRPLRAGELRGAGADAARGGCVPAGRRDVPVLPGSRKRAACGMTGEERSPGWSPTRREGCRRQRSPAGSTTRSPPRSSRRPPAWRGHSGRGT
jgi:hydrogenase maturation protein HypF